MEVISSLPGRPFFAHSLSAQPPRTLPTARALPPCQESIMTMTANKRIRVQSPPRRRLRAFAFDPVHSRNIETQQINEVTINLPWENNLGPGPVDDYLEVVDYDPASQAFYAPVDLNDPRLLAQDGLPPSEGNPQFHQQMVYAVARTTIGHFERALGRRALWSPHLEDGLPGPEDEFVERLRIYPHALREANAYYSPSKKALLFGYFPAVAAKTGENLPGEMVFSCLSHDIVAHETAHALLDGLHRRFVEPSNEDLWAFHEAFADIVALFQHFTYPQVLRQQIARTRGDLEKQNLLGQLAYQFGQAIGSYGALRSALGSFDPQTNQWIPEKPDPRKILETTEPHDRGAILVAALFEAFLTIYKWRIADLLRLASGGTGVLPQGDIHPDLVERLAQEAAKTAGHLLQMCIRALDYCPPVDLNFGDYLRALITADFDLVTDDRHNYRLAVIEAFRRRGIFPRDVRSLSVESLIWHQPTEDEQAAFLKVFGSPEKIRQLVPDWGLVTNRGKIFDQARTSQSRLRDWITAAEGRDAAKAASLVLELDENAPQGFFREETGPNRGKPRLEIHSVRPARRIGPDNQTVTELVIEMTQVRRAYYDAKLQTRVDRGLENSPEADFIFRGGCTLLVNPASAKVKYAIYKNILSEDRLNRMRDFIDSDLKPSLRATYLGDPRKAFFQMETADLEDREEQMAREYFGLLHRSMEAEEVG
jgi:hypothetical protein